MIDNILAKHKNPDIEFHRNELEKIKIQNDYAEFIDLKDPRIKSVEINYSVIPVEESKEVEIRGYLNNVYNMYVTANIQFDEHHFGMSMIADAINNNSLNVTDFPFVKEAKQRILDIYAYKNLLQNSKALRDKVYKLKGIIAYIDDNGEYIIDNFFENLTFYYVKMDDYDNIPMITTYCADLAISIQDKTFKGVYIFIQNKDSDDIYQLSFNLSPRRTTIKTIKGQKDKDYSINILTSHIVLIKNLEPANLLETFSKYKFKDEYKDLKDYYANVNNLISSKRNEKKTDLFSGLRF